MGVETDDIIRFNLARARRTGAKLRELLEAERMFLRKRDDETRHQAKRLLDDCIRILLGDGMELPKDWYLES